MSNVRVVTEDAQFQVELTNAGTKLVVVDFYADWCGPCQRIAPFFNQLSLRYPTVVFVKVNVDQCQQTASSNGVRAMPTFLFFRNKTKVDQLQGADQNQLEEKVKKWMGDEEEEGQEGSGGVGVPGQMNLNSMIMKSGCECLNDSDDHPFGHCLDKGGQYLESDCDEQLIMTVSFNQPVKLHSLKIQGPDNGQAPKTVKVFINQPATPDFDAAERNDAVQQFELTADDVKEDAVINLRYVKFQNIQNVTIFVKDNQGEEETTVVNYLGFIGTPVSATNMTEFKRVAGKKGESH
ncbi:PREDICTED: thioredoxin-like protein 1 isoform X2 [Branchiostoma belcheri]|uniref:Thioredoxin-like protein 1 isoform X1 n=1 Tax=Branchiostoma belcheri TaxID=7741 RepID=A0A6P4YVN3_BRABE|nr:PREDICTED: thioredoxin-like protein 1 isoform X1 [Branchiostoma belcheri]XP_019622797.1 PREDICTED: thioredoxin-like protein 1 isoform X2 [Branchiostoma belcheri]KAI8493678.1 Thioredoxin-like protein 1 [Branchiostoma belcheri]